MKNAERAVSGIGWAVLAVILRGGVSVLAAQEAAPVAASTEATITSDWLELRDNGAQAIFTGQVVLIQAPYRLEADRMIRTKATGIVLADGHVRGTWIADAGEKVVATGRHARYDPGQETSELWGDPRVTRWETERDTAPVVLSAVRLVVHQGEHAVLAEQNVWIRQGARLQVRSEKAKYLQTDQTIHLWGARRVSVHVEDAIRGSADFVSDRGWVSLRSKEARLQDRVHGRVIPRSTL